MKEWIYKLTHWETWHYHIKYIPLLPLWLWCIIKARNFWFFTAANPSLSFGGMDGERKWEMYSNLPFGSYPLSVFIEPSESLQDILKAMEEAGLKFPVAAKPDMGMGGMMFKKIYTKEQLSYYHSVMDRTYVLQELILWPMEVSVFYYRIPGQKKGTITGLIKKENPVVTGDGVSTLTELVQKHEAAHILTETLQEKHQEKINKVLLKGEVFVLEDVHNRSRGAKIISLSNEIDERLLRVMDELSLYSNTFFYGRFDIKCNSIEDLKSGMRFSVLEFNGSGSGVQQVYGNGYSLTEACSIIAQHWKTLCRISIINYGRGIRKWSFKEGWNFLKNAKQELAHLKQIEKAYNELQYR
jgi:hypothetical protein